jgi:hypothetical protein
LAGPCACGGRGGEAWDRRAGCRGSGRRDREEEGGRGVDKNIQIIFLFKSEKTLLQHNIIYRAKFFNKNPANTHLDGTFWRTPLWSA